VQDALDLAKDLDRLLIGIITAERPPLLIGRQRPGDENMWADPDGSCIADLILPWCPGEEGTTRHASHDIMRTGGMMSTNAGVHLASPKNGWFPRMIVYPIAVLLIAGGLLMISRADRTEEAARLRLVAWINLFNRALDDGPGSTAWQELEESDTMSGVILDRLRPLQEELAGPKSRGLVEAQVEPRDVLNNPAVPAATHSMFVKVEGTTRIVLRLECTPDHVTCLGFIDPEYFR